VAQVEECLLCKFEPCVQIPVPPKKKKKQQQQKKEAKIFPAQ
jgi:hypothetical protein